MRLWPLLIGFLFLVGCPGATPSATPAVPGKCTKAFEKCKLPAGPLGVCDYGKCADGPDKGKLKCLMCIPQH